MPGNEKNDFERVLKRTLPAAWLALLLFLLVTSATAAFPEPWEFHAMALAGWLLAFSFERESLRAVLLRHRLPVLAALLIVAGMIESGFVLQLRFPDRPWQAQPAQAGLLLAIAPLAALLADRARMRLAVLVLAAVSMWHLIALPLEAIYGIKWSWFVPDLLPRRLGPLNYQASGLAWQVYYFPGLFLGAFYLAAGAIGEERLFGRRTFDAKTWLAASLAWALAIACLQSRSAFAGALAASLLGLIAFAHLKSTRMWIVAGGIALAGAALFWLLFSQNKSGPGLRWAYMMLYLRHSFDPQWLWTGRGYTIFPDTTMQVPGLQYLQHAHDDFIQVFFAWGLPTLLAYLLLWASLARLALGAWRQGRWWPALSIVAVGPSVLTDLGLHHVEKTAFVAMLAAMGIAFDAGLRSRIKLGS